MILGFGFAGRALPRRADGLLHCDLLRCNARDGDIYLEGRCFPNRYFQASPYTRFSFCTLAPVYQRRKTHLYTCSELCANIVCFMRSHSIM